MLNDLTFRWNFTRGSPPSMFSMLWKFVKTEYRVCTVVISITALRESFISPHCKIYYLTNAITIINYANYVEMFHPFSEVKLNAAHAGLFVALLLITYCYFLL
jgi:hypothetical protein